VVVYGDTNSTIAASIAAAHSCIPLVHIESGLRSFNREMPEEINRIVTDHLSTLLFCPSATASQQLLKEGFSMGRASEAKASNPILFECGDIMLDNAMHYGVTAQKPAIENFIFLTLHRPSNVDNADVLIEFLEGLIGIAKELDLTLLFPIHPRTLKTCESSSRWVELANSTHLQLTSPMPYTETIGALKHARLVWTDSGGLCKEAFMMGTPCLILRSETEWVELVDNGYAYVVHNNLNSIKDKSILFLKQGMPPMKNLYGDGNAAQFIHDTLVQYLNA
jgi:UDP-GlcNAc3NAcA epimerase